MSRDELDLMLGTNYVPEGEYEVKLHDMSIETAVKGHPYYIANFEIANGDYVGRKIKQIWSFRYEAERQTAIRIRNFTEKTGRTLKISNLNAHSAFNELYGMLSGKTFLAYYVKKPDSQDLIAVGLA